MQGMQGARHMGYLQKLSPKFSFGIDLWQTRFFVLQARSLVYYKTEPLDKSMLDGDNLCGEMSLSEIKRLVEKTEENRFDIIMSNKHKRKKTIGNVTYELKASSAADLKLWLDYLRKTKHI